jgi:uroporphyrinogen-III decarboxylase
MDRSYYLNLAASELRMPIGTDLVLHEQTDPKAVLLDGRRLGQVVLDAARRYHTPLALAHMDLEVEKAVLLEWMGIDPQQFAAFHFDELPSPAMLARFHQHLPGPLPQRLQAHVEAVAFVAAHADVLPVAMCIGPFSLTTKLLADPITPIFMAGSGATAGDEPEVKRFEAVLGFALEVVIRSISAKIQAGAKAVCIAEPAANRVFVSPRQIEKGADIFDRYVMRGHQAIRHLLAQSQVDLIFHCCGELTEYFVRKFAALDPAILSLGSSRKLWEDAAWVPKTTVLFGNLPTKRFYADNLLTVEEVANQARALRQHMREVNHPFILGSECDVLSVPGCETTIKAKVDAFLKA